MDFRCSPLLTLARGRQQNSETELQLRSARRVQAWADLTDQPRPQVPTATLCRVRTVCLEAMPHRPKSESNFQLGCRISPEMSPKTRESGMPLPPPDRFVRRVLCEFAQQSD